MFMHHQKRKHAEFEILLSPYMDKKKRKRKTPHSALFGTAAEYARMTEKQKIARQKAMDSHWGKNPIM